MNRSFAKQVIPDHYLQITKQIGSGNWSTVYEAFNLDRSEKYAVKIIPQKVFEDFPKIEELSRAEINILKHNGGDLGQKLLKQGPLPESTAIHYLKQILDGFKGLHEVRAMHRDFKVQNVMLHNQDVCKIVDLGFGKQFAEEDTTATKLGSNMTMAPQVMLRRPYGFKADIWSIGVVYYQLLQNCFPFVGRNIQAILQVIKNNQINYSRVDISPQSIDFIKRCLVMDPQERISWKEIYEHPLIADKRSSMQMFDEGSYVDVEANFSFYQKEAGKKEFRPSEIYSFIDKAQNLKEEQQEVKKEDKNAQRMIDEKEEMEDGDGVSEIIGDFKFKSDIRQKTVKQHSHQDSGMSVDQKWQLFKRNYDQMIKKQWQEYNRAPQQHSDSAEQHQEAEQLPQEEAKPKRVRPKFEPKPKDNYFKQPQQNTHQWPPSYPARHVNRDTNGLTTREIYDITKKIKALYSKRLNDGRFAPLLILQRWTRLKHDLRELQNYKYLCILIKDSYLKVMDLNRDIIMQNNIFGVDIQHFKYFNQIYKDKLEQILVFQLGSIQSTFKELKSEAGKQRWNQLDQQHLNNLDYPAKGMASWKAYLTEEIRQYWHNLTRLFFRQKNPNQQILVHIFCLRQFEMNNKNDNFSFDKLSKILTKFNANEEKSKLLHKVIKGKIYRGTSAQPNNCQRNSNIRQNNSPPYTSKNHQYYDEYYQQHQRFYQPHHQPLSKHPPSNYVNNNVQFTYYNNYSGPSLGQGMWQKKQTVVKVRKQYQNLGR